MTPFQKHNIRHLSPSSLALYQAEPALWCGRYLLGWPNEVGPAAWVGTAVEDGLTAFLHGEPDALERALQSFTRQSAGVIDDATAKGRSEIEPMLAQAMTALAAQKGCRPISQAKIEYFFDGVSVPIIGYIDYSSPALNGILDLKTTRAMPSEPRPAHLAQVGLYSLARKEPARLLYVTPKKWAFYPIEDAEAAVQPLRLAALAVQNMLDKADTGADAIGMFAADTSSFYWTDASRAAYAGEMVGGKIVRRVDFTRN